MQYRGIQYDVKVGVRRHEWVWVVHTPTPRQGSVIGLRQGAIFSAERAIDRWCKSKPDDCETRPAAA
jgi:hypothetical protein